MTRRTPGREMGRAEAVRLFVCDAPLNMLLLDLNLRLIAASPGIRRNLDCELDDIVGRPIGDVVPGANRAAGEIVDRLAAGAAQHNVASRARMPNGERRWYETEGWYWRDDAGDAAGYILTSRDITVERDAEAARQTMEGMMRAVIDNLPGTLAVQDFETQEYLLVNAQTARTLGMTAAELVGKKLSDIVAEEHNAAVTQQIARLRRDGGVDVDELGGRSGTLDGRTLRMRRLLFDDGAGRTRILSIGEDITDLREANDALEKAVADAEAANAAKSRFLANISHEIRTPLNGVLGMAQAMSRDPLSRRQRERLDTIRQSGETLLLLLNDLLDISKIEAGKIELEDVRFDLAEIVRIACAPFRPIAEQKGVALVVNAGAGADHRRGDPTRLGQVVANLVSNAVKFTSQGRVEVAVSGGDDVVHVAVADTGTGIGQRNLETMFEKFTQADVSTTRRFGGTGLGLAICRELVELMGGRIEVSSTPGEGSRFSFALPLPRVEAPAAAAAPAVASESPQALKVLAAEDNKINRLVLKTLLEPFGLDLTMVENGVQALSAWERESWDAILMDVQMPVMDGVAATAEIRSREAAEGRPRTPIVALTANAMAHQATDYIGAGMDAVVSKPIRLNDLLQALNAVARSPDAPGVAQAV